MLAEYWKRVQSAIRWLVPFFVAVFLLFGCSPAVSGQTAAETGNANVTEAVRETAADSQEDGQAPPEETPESSAQSTAQSGDPTQEEEKQAEDPSVSEDGRYTSKEEVALYLHTFGHLPENYITKKDAEAAGWVSREGNLWDVAPGMSIGGSRFGNYEGLLPDEKGRAWYECDIDFDGTYRNAKRIIYSNDGLIYYTEDHYKSFEQLY